MECCVRTCVNRAKITNNSTVSFHKFPTNEQLKNTWMDILGLTKQSTSETRLICSEHFHRTDVMYDRKSGKWKIRNGATPVQMDRSELESPAATKVCRVCLAIGVKMYHITEKNLLIMYESVTGLDMEPDDKLPKMCCWECAAGLKSASRFKEKAIRVHDLLSARAEEDKFLAVKDVERIKSDENTFISNLSIEFATEHYDMIAKHDDSEEVKEEFKLEIDESVDYLLNVEELTEAKLDLEDNSIKCDDKLEDNAKDDKSDDSDFTLDNLKSDGDFDSDSDSDYNKPVKRIMKMKKETDKKVGVKGLSKSVKKDGVVKKTGKRFREKRAGVKRAGSEKHGGVKKRVKTEKKEGGMKKVMDFKNFSPSEIIERYRKTEVVKRTNMEDFTVTALNFEDQIAELQNRQESISYLKAPYKCTVCYTGFQLQACLDTHSIRHSEKYGQFECFICKRRFEGHVKLRRHITALHTEQYACKKCDYVTRNKETAVKHLNWHKGKKYSCPNCDKEFSKPATYFSHVRIAHPSKYACEVCGYTFVSLRGVDQHRKTRHTHFDDTIRLEGPFCESCDVTFANKEAYDRHLLLSAIHNKEGHNRGHINNPYRLNKPEGGEFPPRPKKKREKPSPEKRRILTCEVCDKKLNGNREYNTHIKTYHPGHNRTKYAAGMATMCEVCGKIFTCEATLKQHMLIHTGENKFKCDMCNKQFCYANTLREHRLIHSGVKHKCPHCHKIFAFVANLRRHVKSVHDGLSSFQCDICGKKFTSAGNRKEHIKHVHDRLPRPKRVRVRNPREKLYSINEDM